MRAMTTALALVAMFFCGGCDVLLDALTSTTQGVSVLTRTPDLANTAGLDPNLSTLLFTGAQSPAGNLNLGATGIVVAAAERDDPLSTATPTPLADLSVALNWGSNSVNLCAAVGEAGTYTATNVDTNGSDPCVDPNLVYTQGKTYTTEITLTDFIASVSVEAPAAIGAGNVTFSPALAAATDHFGATLKSHSPNTALTVDWSADPAAGKPAFMVVIRIRYSGGAGGASGALEAANWTVDPDPIFDNLPRRPEALIDIVFGSSPTSADIPGGTFDQTGLYFLILTSTALGTNTNHLAIGSGAMAGYGTAFVFWVD